MFFRLRTGRSGFRFLGMLHFRLVGSGAGLGGAVSGGLLCGARCHRCGRSRRIGLRRFLRGYGVGNGRFGGSCGFGIAALSKQAGDSYGKHCGQQVLFHRVLNESVVKNDADLAGRPT